MDTLLNIVNYVYDHRDAIIGIVLIACSLSVTLEALLTKFQVQSKKLAFTAQHVLAGITAASTLLGGSSGKAATGTYAGLFIAMGAWHRFAVSPANTKYVTPFLNWLANQNANKASNVTISTPQGTSTTVLTTPLPVTAAAVGAEAKPFTLDQPGK